VSSPGRPRDQVEPSVVRAALVHLSDDEAAAVYEALAFFVSEFEFHDHVTANRAWPHAKELLQRLDEAQVALRRRDQ